jgi:uncharacterized protein YjbI with pentapeptide repeats
VNDKSRYCEQSVEIRDTTGTLLGSVADKGQLCTLNLRKAVLVGMELEGINLESADLTGADLTGCNLYWSYLRGATLTGTTLRKAELRGANLRDTELRGADLRWADLSLDNVGAGTQLQGADLRGAALEGVNLTGAEYDDETRFPDGFDPSSHGMTKVARPDLCVVCWKRPCQCGKMPRFGIRDE